MAGLFSIFDKKKVGSFGIEELLSGLTDKSIESEKYHLTALRFFFLFKKKINNSTLK